MAVKFSKTFSTEMKRKKIDGVIYGQRRHFRNDSIFFFSCFIFKMINIDWEFVRGFIQIIFVLKIFVAIKNKIGDFGRPFIFNDDRNENILLTFSSKIVYFDLTVKIFIWEQNNSLF